jgi:hypothetical protein
MRKRYALPTGCFLSIRSEGWRHFLSSASRSPHLWTIISDPDQDNKEIIVVYFTTFEDYKDQACAIETGEHPKITHKSLVAYRDYVIFSSSQLKKMATDGKIKIEAPLSVELLKRIRSSAHNSRLPMGRISFLDRQGLL